MYKQNTDTEEEVNILIEIRSVNCQVAWNSFNDWSRHLDLRLIAFFIEGMSHKQDYYRPVILFLYGQLLSIEDKQLGETK